MVRQATRIDYQQRILRVLTYIQQHLDDALTPADLASVACFSKHHFHRIFRGMTGESVMGHIRRLRLERAAWRLKFSDRPVTRIAFEAGFESHEAFTRAFHAFMGDTPIEFRAKQRGIEFPPSPSGVHYDEQARVTGLQPMVPPVEDLEVTICTFKPRTVAFVRHFGPYDAVGEAWDKLMIWAGQQGLISPLAEMLGLCYDDPDIVSEPNIRYDACLAVQTPFEPSGEFGRQEIAGGEYAVIRHVGPYQNIGAAYLTLLGHWLPASGRQAATGPCLEQYWNDPEGTEPQDLETDVCVPLEPETAF